MEQGLTAAVLLPTKLALVWATFHRETLLPNFRYQLAYWRETKVVGRLQVVTLLGRLSCLLKSCMGDSRTSGAVVCTVQGSEQIVHQILLMLLAPGLSGTYI
jgi:hypothetical protein